MSRRRVRNIAVVTGTRAEYGVLQSTLRAIDAHPRLCLQLVVTGMHLLAAFGNTRREIERDGWRIGACVPMQAGDDSPGDQAAGLGRGVSGIARFLEEARTDIVVVLGDRIEAMAGALAAVTTGRLLAHIHGGDVAPGDFDDSLRHAITKLAHVHFPATRAAARRIVRLGEAPSRVVCVGAPGLDRLREILRERPARDHAEPREGHDTAMILYHAHGRPAAVERRVMEAVLHGTRSLRTRRIVIYPNSDRGHSGVIAAIEACRGEPGVRILKSIPRDDYLRLLIEARVLVGNSSSGVIEAPFAGTPVVNVGGRQRGRDAGGASVVHVGESLAAIRAGLCRALRQRPRPGRRTIYGDGRAGQRIAAHLATIPLTDQLRRKCITY